MQIAEPVEESQFNPDVTLSFGLTCEHIQHAMADFIRFLEIVNGELLDNGIERLEEIVQTAAFSGTVSEFMGAHIPLYCDGLVENRFHNGHPDMIPAGEYEDDSVQYGEKGVEVKASRDPSRWQGHNAEECWLMVFLIDSNRRRDVFEGIPEKPFRFLAVYGAQLDMDDWSFSGRSDTSRRTITASVRASGRDKMKQNWIYEVPELSSE